MKEIHDEIRNLQDIDPVQIAEDLGIGIGVALAIQKQKSEQMMEMLTLNDDTHMCMKVPEFLRLLKRLGFQMLIEDKIEDRREEKINYHRVFWHPDGILLNTDSYLGDDTVNSGNVYLYYKGNYDHISISGGGSRGLYDPEGEQDLWEISKDIREGLRMFLEVLKDGGEILKQWPKNSRFLWLLNYMDTKVEGYDWKEIVQRIKDRLPEEVQKCMNHEFK